MLLSARVSIAGDYAYACSAHFVTLRNTKNTIDINNVRQYDMNIPIM